MLMYIFHHIFHIYKAVAFSVCDSGLWLQYKAVVYWEFNA